jgi:hypothetical protein
MARIVEIIELTPEQREASRQRPESPVRLRSITAVMTAAKVLAVMMGVAMIAQAVPAYYRHNEFDNFLKEQVGAPVSASQLKQALLAKAGDWALPLKDENIVVRKAEGTFSVAVDYTVPVDLVLFRQDLKFHSAASGFLPK